MGNVEIREFFNKDKINIIKKVLKLFIRLYLIFESRIDV